MKKRRYPSLFPKSSSKEEKILPPLRPNKYKIKLGARFQIGDPVNQSYLYLRESLLERESNSRRGLLPNKLIGHVVVITGILKLANDEQTSILERDDKKSFFRGQTRIYADITNAVVARELIVL